MPDLIALLFSSHQLGSAIGNGSPKLDAHIEVDLQRAFEKPRKNELCTRTVNTDLELESMRQNPMHKSPPLRPADIALATAPRKIVEKDGYAMRDSLPIKRIMSKDSYDPFITLGKT